MSKNPSPLKSTSFNCNLKGVKSCVAITNRSLQHSNKNKLHFLLGIMFGFVLQAKLRKRCNSPPSALLLLTFLITRNSSKCRYGHLHLSSLMNENFVQFKWKYSQNIKEFKGILIKKCRNQFPVFEPADNLNKLQCSVSIVFSYTSV